MSRSPLLRYGVAVAAGFVALPTAVVLQPYIEPNFFQIFLGAVMVSGLYGGLGPGLLTTLLASLFTAYAFLPPLGSFAIAPEYLPRFCLFLAVAFFVSILNEARWRAVERSRRLLFLEQAARQDAEAEREWNKNILESISDGFVAIDRKWRYSYVNQKAAELARKSKEDLLGKDFAEAFTETVGSRFYCEIRRVGEEQVAAHFEEFYPRFNAWFEINAYPSKDGVSVFARDITERKRAELSHAILHASMRAVAESPSTREAATKILQEICQGLAWEIGGLWRVDREAGVLRLVTHWSAQDLPVPEFRSLSSQMTFLPGIGLPGLVWQSRTPRWVPDFARESFPRSKSAAHEGLHAAFAFPIIFGGEVVAVMEFFSREIREPDSELLEMIATVGVQISQFMERKRIEVAVRESEARKSAILESALDGVITMDHEGRTTEFNPAATATFGYSREEAIGRPLADLIIPPSLRERHIQGLARYLESGSGPVIGRRIEMTAMRKDGSEFPVELAVTRIRLDGPPLFTAYVRDITDRKRAEQALAEQARELERSNKELEQFAYVASHDLQEPLRMVASFTQLLAQRYRGKLDADAEEFIGFTLNGVNRMHQLINDLLTYSRVGRRGKGFATSDCEGILAVVLDNLRVSIAETGARITHGPLPAVWADGTQLVQLFQNLIGNAIKFHREESPRIHVEAKPADGQWLFSVNDNGVGIDSKHLERIFVIFQRLHTRGEYPGTGIGLAVCKKIVERHGGRIWAESRVGLGSAFRFTLPAAPDASREGAGPSSAGSEDQVDVMPSGKLSG